MHKIWKSKMWFSGWPKFEIYDIPLEGQHQGHRESQESFCQSEHKQWLIEEKKPPHPV